MMDMYLNNDGYNMVMNVNHNFNSSIQLMVDGVSLMIGPSALLLVEEEPRPGPEPAPDLHTVEQTVLEKAVRLKSAILTTVQVKLIQIFNPPIMW